MEMWRYITRSTTDSDYIKRIRKIEGDIKVNLTTIKDGSHGGLEKVGQLMNQNTVHQQKTEAEVGAIVNEILNCARKVPDLNARLTKKLKESMLVWMLTIKGAIEEIYKSLGIEVAFSTDQKTLCLRKIYTSDYRKMIAKAILEECNNHLVILQATLKYLKKFSIDLMDNLAEIVRITSLLVKTEIVE